MAKRAQSLAREITRDLRVGAPPHRAGTVDGHSLSSLEVLGTTVPAIRALVRQTAKSIQDEPPAFVVELAQLLVADGTLEARQVAYELLGRRKDARATLRIAVIEALGRGIDNWKSVDVFGCEVTGYCWREGRLTDAAVRRWAASGNRWWRRTALVSTIPLNMKSRGGAGDAKRTLDICARCVGDRDDMVVKALSWALRELGRRDATAARAFVAEHQSALAARVVREVGNKLDSGVKNPKR
jgi:3-methyladenine DNA glycosylase AlkD